MNFNHRFPILSAMILVMILFTSLARSQSIDAESLFNNFSNDADSILDKKKQSKYKLNSKSTIKDQSSRGNCGGGEWAQCDFDGINN